MSLGTVCPKDEPGSSPHDCLAFDISVFHYQESTETSALHRGGKSVSYDWAKAKAILNHFISINILAVLNFKSQML